MSQKPAAVVILAAGQGTRMKTTLPKVLHRIGGRSLLGHVMTAAQSTDPDHLVVVVRHDREAVADHAREVSPGVIIADQDEIPGTGRAAWCAMAALPEGLAGPVLVLAADVPLLNEETLNTLLQAHTRGGVTILSSEVENPTGYGRIIRDDAGNVEGIVEEKDTTEEERGVKEINSAVYVFDAELLRDALERVDDKNAQKEIYLTDVIGIARRGGRPVQAVVSEDSMVAEGVNDLVQLATLGAELNRRTLQRWMKSGVKIVDPATTWIDSDASLEPNVEILPGTHILGHSQILDGAVLGPDTTIENTVVGSGAQVIRSHATDSQIGQGAQVGPFSYIRQETVLEQGAKIGPFAEMKNSHLGPGAKLPHLSYLGDAVVGQGTNIGAGTITANYDGVNKYRTTIGAYARVGSANMLVPPITIGDGAYTGAGTTLRNDVPPGALAVPEAGGEPVGQNNIEGWTERKRPGSASAHAARSAHPHDSAEPTNPQQEKPR